MFFSVSVFVSEGKVTKLYVCVCVCVCVFVNMIACQNDLKLKSQSELALFYMFRTSLEITKT